MTREIFVNLIRNYGIEMDISLSEIRERCEDSEIYWQILIGEKSNEFNIVERNKKSTVIKEDNDDKFFLYVYVYLYKQYIFEKVIRGMLMENSCVYEEKLSMDDVSKILEKYEIGSASKLKIDVMDKRLFINYAGEIVFDRELDSTHNALFLYLQWYCYFYYFSHNEEFWNYDIAKRIVMSI